MSGLLGKGSVLRIRLTAPGYEVRWSARLSDLEQGWAGDEDIVCTQLMDLTLPPCEKSERGLRSLNNFSTLEEAGTQIQTLLSFFLKRIAA